MPTRYSGASLYAKQAGVDLKSVLDPFWEAADHIKSQNEVLERAAGSWSPFTQALAKKGVLPGADAEEATQQAAEALIKDVFKLTSSATIFIETFRNLPKIDDSKLAKFDQAIEVLRGNEAPNDRPEQARVYQAVLSAVRLTSMTKKLLGDQDWQSLLHDKGRLCNLDVVSLHAATHEIHRSLMALGEGLSLRPDETINRQRAIRVRVRGYVDQIMKSKLFSIAKHLVTVSTHKATVDDRAAAIASATFCKTKASSDD